MALADSFYPRTGDVTVVEARRLNNFLQYSKVVNYVLARQNEDGGYCFAQGALESNGQDTYYGLAILNQLGSDFPNIEKTIRFLNENRIDNIYSMYYTAKAEMLLGQDINDGLKKDISILLDSVKYFGSNVFFSDSSELKLTLMALELTNFLKRSIDPTDITIWLNNFQNEDGGFGPKGHSNLDSTYHATACLCLLKARLDREKILRFVRSCEKPYGGFTVIPINFTPYMEHTFYGVKTLDLLGDKCRYPSQTIDWTLSCQKGTGGFARSDLGIATFVDTYYAIEIVRQLQNGLM